MGMHRSLSQLWQDRSDTREDLPRDVLRDDEARRSEQNEQEPDDALNGDRSRPVGRCGVR